MMLDVRQSECLTHHRAIMVDDLHHRTGNVKTFHEAGNFGPEPCGYRRVAITGLTGLREERRSHHTEEQATDGNRLHRAPTLAAAHVVSPARRDRR
jgi:hypothetical protein